MAVSRSVQEESLSARLPRGAVGGILAGVVFAAVTMWFADSTRMVNRPMSLARELAVAWPAFPRRRFTSHTVLPIASIMSVPALPRSLRPGVNLGQTRS